MSGISENKTAAQSATFKQNASMLRHLARLYVTDIKFAYRWTNDAMNTFGYGEEALLDVTADMTAVTRAFAESLSPYIAEANEVVQAWEALILSQADITDRPAWKDPKINQRIAVLTTALSPTLGAFEQQLRALNDAMLTAQFDEILASSRHYVSMKSIEGSAEEYGAIDWGHTLDLGRSTLPSAHFGQAA